MSTDLPHSTTCGGRLHVFSPKEMDGTMSDMHPEGDEGDSDDRWGTAESRVASTTSNADQVLIRAFLEDAEEPYKPVSTHL